LYASVGQDQGVGPEIRAGESIVEGVGSLSDPIDYEVEYNNRAGSGKPALIAGWAKDAAAYRKMHAPRAYLLRLRRASHH